MDEDFLWAILGLALVIVELLTGTFYLLVLGIAASNCPGCQIGRPGRSRAGRLPGSVPRAGTIKAAPRRQSRYASATTQ